MDERRFSEEGRSQWSVYSKSVKSGYLSRFKNILTRIVAAVFPKNVEEITNTLFKLESDQTVKSCILPEGTFGQLVNSYQRSESWGNRRQLLSVITQAMTYKEVVQLLPDVTENKYYAAKRHAKTIGPGVPVQSSMNVRQRMDPSKLDHFLDFITSPHVIRDLPYGERKMRMSDGSVQEMPNVIRCMGASDTIQHYKMYCSENGISPLGKQILGQVEKMLM